MGELLWYHWSPLLVTHLAGKGFYFIVTMPLSHMPRMSHCGFLSLDMGYLFLEGSSILLLITFQQLVVILELSQEEMRAHASTLPSELEAIDLLFIS